MTNLAGLPPRGLKSTTYISKKLRNFARGQECTMRIPGVCNRDTATTVLCHVRTPGTGVGKKPHDFLGFHGCSACHDFQESGQAGWDDVLIAVFRTQERVYRHFGTLTP